MPDLHTRELTFVNDRFVREGSQIKPDRIFLNRTLYQVTGIIPEDEKFPFEFFGMADMIRTCNEYLFNIRFTRQSGWSYSLRINGHFPVSQHFQTQLIRCPVEYITTLFFEHESPWKKDH